MSNNQHTTSVGILGIGVYLPEEVRTNDWWPAPVVDRWRQKFQRDYSRLTEQLVAQMPAGPRGILNAMRELANDPFQGARQRHVIAPGMKASEMEILASEDAIKRSGIAARDIDLLLTYSICPDYLTTPNACAVHKGLGLRQACFSMATEAACNSFLMQLTIAQQMILSGQASTALLVQSCNLLSLIPSEAPYSAWFGDGATAVVVGPVPTGLGVLAHSHQTDGRFHDSVVSCVREKRWFEDGRIEWYSADPERANEMLTNVSDLGKYVVDDVLAKTGHAHDEVDYYASHQATHWFRRCTQAHIGLTRARTHDIFPWTGSLSASNIPLVLATGEREGTLRKGDLVATFSGGSGITWSSVLLRWGK